MSQWGQPGFQYPMQTGFPGAQPQQQFQPAQQLNPSFQQSQGGFGVQPGALGLGPGLGSLPPQPTGFPGTRPQGLQQPGFTAPQGVGAGFLQTQPTGFPGAQSNFQQHAPPPPIPPLPTSYQQKAHPPPPPVPQQQPTFLQTNQSRLGGPSASSFAAPSLVTQPTGIGLLSQPTGFAARAPAPLVPQVTGFVDPRLQMMSSSFMPANASSPYTSGGLPQLPPPQQQLGGLSLQQSFQQHNQAHGRGTAPKVPWALSKAEKKQYDQIFRAWDTQGTGFINGQTALEVFGQSGLDRNDLARIWTLADADNRGKLNLAEFHVAMGLIYRRLNGNDIPDELPAELVPPSSRDLDTSVNFLKDILKNDSRSRSPSGLDVPVSRLKERSFTSSSSFTQQGGRQDATVYKHEDVEPPGGFYQPRNRHVDRSTIRSRADDANSATSDLSSIKRQLLNTQKILDDTLASERSSDALDRELEDLRYRITRLQEDLEYVSKGPRTTTKEEERRRLERELVRLMHEEVPDLEKKVEEREARREREKREWARDRDRRNERFGRYGGEDGYSSPSRYREEEERPYSRSASRYDRDDRDRDHDRDRSRREEDRDRNRDADNERDRGDRDRGKSTTTRSPPPPPSTISTPSQPPPPSTPARSPAPSMKNMTPEERQAFIRAEAQRRLEARKQALGVVAPSSASVVSPTLDTTIEDRLTQEKKEAEEKAREAERQAEERQKQRREKLEAERALKAPTATTTAPRPTPASAPAPTPVTKAAPPPPKPRAPAPPPPRKGAMSRTPAAPTPSKAPAPSVPAPPPARAIPSPAPPPPPPAPVVPDENHEDAALKAREEALRKRREEHAALLRKLEEEEEEARKAEAAYQERRNQFLSAKAPPAATTPPALLSPPVPAPPPAPPAPVRPQVAEPAEKVTPSPPPPPPPSAPVPTTDKPSNNPFSRLMKDGGSSVPAPPPAAAANGSSNPFFRSQTAPPAAPPPPKSPGIPPPVKTTYHTAPKDSDDDWDDVMEKDEDDSSDEELGTRDTRMGLAQQLFGNLLPSRPQSAGPTASSGSPISPAPPPPPPPAPTGPPLPSAPIASPAPTGDRGALLNAIQGGARLRKTVTNDRSGAATSGKVIGDNASPGRIDAITRPLSPPTIPLSTTSPVSVEPPPASLMEQSTSLRHEKKESMDWYNALAADVDKGKVDRLPVTAEEQEEEEASAGAVPAIQVSDHAPGHDPELMSDVDLSSEIRVRSLYPYEGQRTEDLDFDANMVIVAHPSKSGGDWWYGTAIKNGKVGFFPQTYVQRVEQVYATALYAYESTNEDELAFNEGDNLTIVDRSEMDWWKAERDGLVFIVPAAYLEPIEGFALGVSGHVRSRPEPNEGRSANYAGFDGESDRPERMADIYSTPHTSPRDVRRLELHGTSSMNEDDEDEEDAYYSLDDEDASESAQELDPQDERETVACEIERRRALEAAGLVVSPLVDEKERGGYPHAYGPSSGVMPEAHEHVHGHSKSASDLASLAGLLESPRRRRPAPAVPQRGLTQIRTKNLPPVPTIDLQRTDTSLDAPFRSFDIAADRDIDAGQVLGDVEGTSHFKAMSEGSIVHPDDAFERYETFKKMQGSHGHRHGHSPVAHGPPTSASTNRMSMSSFDTGPLTPASPSRSSAASVTPSLRERERESGNAGGGGESRTSQFLSFLGRHTYGTRATTPDNAERDRKLVISGPILHAPTPSLVSAAPSFSGDVGVPTREGSPVFGSSWASLVDRSALEGIPKQERKRQEAIFELISTEADYVRDVQLIVELFYFRLIEVLDEKATEIIFSNIEDILLTNTTFLSTLEERQRDCRLYIDRIGDLLEKHIPNMGVYLNYCINQANAGKTLQQMRETNPALALQLQNLREDSSARNLDLSSYLLVPMQRLTRYPLLIRQIMHYTPDTAPSSSSPARGDIAERQSILTSLQTAERILDDVNEAIRDREGRERLEEVSRTLWIGQGRLDLTAPTRHLGPRKLLKESVLSKARSGRKLRVLLCSDILVLVTEADKGLYRVPIPIHEIQVKPSRTGREDSYIRIQVAYPRGGDMIVLRASSTREAKAWANAISDANKKALEGIRNAVQKPGEM